MPRLHLRRRNRRRRRWPSAEVHAALRRCADCGRSAMHKPFAAPTEGLRLAADMSRAGAAIALLAQYDKTPPGELILAGSDQLPAEVLDAVAAAQTVALSASALLRQKAPAATDWRTLPPLLIRLAQELDGVVRSRQ